MKIIYDKDIVKYFKGYKSDRLQNRISNPLPNLIFDLDSLKTEINRANDRKTADK